MPLETYSEPAELHLARGDEVNERRPVFTGDIFADVAVPGVHGSDMAMIVAHPCSMRGPVRGYYDMTPLPEVDGTQMYVGRFSHLGMVPTAELATASRQGCLSVYGVNLLDLAPDSLRGSDVPASRSVRSYLRGSRHSRGVDRHLLRRCPDNCGRYVSI